MPNCFAIPPNCYTFAFMNLTLLQLNTLVKETIAYSMPDTYWVEAELSECRESGGHCYMDLIQKDEFSNTPVARAQARCWRSTWVRLKPRFERVTGQTLHSGMKVLLNVKANFHESFGFAWIVNDIDPNYTMGDMARRRQEIIQTLKKEGVYDLNKSLPIPMFAQRVAVISSASAAGYGDFCNHLIENDYGIVVKTRLFPAIMQGELVEESIIAALDEINEHVDDFDLVVIIRGGGATSDLSGFDTLALAENVANFPLPIITGIGHERDECVLDMISCVSVKTPTAAADFIVGNLASTLDRVNEAGNRIIEHVKRRMDFERQRIAHIQSFLPVAFSLVRTRESARLDRMFTRLQSSFSQRANMEMNRLASMESRIPVVLHAKLEKEGYRLDMLEQRVNALDPIHILRRGYSIAIHNGKALKSPKDVAVGDEVSIMLAEGVVETVVMTK